MAIWIEQKGIIDLVNPSEAELELGHDARRVPLCQDECAQRYGHTLLTFGKLQEYLAREKQPLRRTLMNVPNDMVIDEILSPNDMVMTETLSANRNRICQLKFYPPTELLARVICP